MSGALGTTNNGTGFKVDGNSNILDTNNGVTNNSADGVVISGSGNVVKEYIMRSNGGNGIKVEAEALNTTLSENRA